MVRLACKVWLVTVDIVVRLVWVVRVVWLVRVVRLLRVVKGG